MVCVKNMFICVILLWISTTSGLHAGEMLSDEQLATSPFIRQLLERVSVLEARDQKQQQEIDDLRAEVNTQKTEILELRRCVVKRDRQILKLFGVIHKKETKVKTPTDQHDRKTLLKRDNGDVSRIRRLGNEVTVAFFSGLTHHIQHAGENQNVVFDKVETNIGNGYNSHQGVFTAPVAGTYFFTTSIMTTSGRKICEIVVNGTKKAQLYTHGDGHYDHSTQTVIIRLNKADDVSVQIIEHNNDNLIYGENPPYTTFSGFLLQQDDFESGTIVG